MAKDPAFLFYPGDYLRDTQMLSEKTQVAYDRIMCEHMRNICIRQQQLNFITKRLSDDEKEELLMVLEEIGGGFVIPWVAESIVKRRKYSESRRNNRTKKGKTYDKHMKTYEQHMENENENENISKEEREKEFRLSAKEFTEKYSEDMITAFCNYWTESNPAGKKLRFELSKNQPFDIKRRLVTWSNNNFNGNSKINGRKQKSSNKSVAELEIEKLQKQYSENG